jgi:hypothetical protein
LNAGDEATISGCHRRVVGIDALSGDYRPGHGVESANTETGFVAMLALGWPVTDDGCGSDKPRPWARDAPVPVRAE